MIAFRLPGIAARRGDPDAPGRSTPTIAGDVLLHPVVLASIAILIANDHVLKGAAPGWLTGKLSDVAGLVFFPLLLIAAWELLRWALRRRVDPSARSVIAAVVVTGLAFASVKTTEPGASVFAWGLGTVQWLVASTWSAVVAEPAPAIEPVNIVRDPTDLVALLALGCAAAIGLARVRRLARVSCWAAASDRGLRSRS
jgi:hypothetical protein